jgi:ferredoxin
MRCCPRLLLLTLMLALVNKTIAARRWNGGKNVAAWIFPTPHRRRFWCDGAVHRHPVPLWFTNRQQQQQRSVASAKPTASITNCESVNGPSMVPEAPADKIIMHKVQWRTKANEDRKESNGATTATIEFDAYEGETLRTAALRRGLISPHNGKARLINCRGLGTCGTCAVEISGENVDPPTRNAVEQLRLSLPPHSLQSPNFRLACQVQIRSDIVVTKRTGFWGQGEEMAEASEAETYFGELEFLLDRKSPPPLDVHVKSDKES